MNKKMRFITHASMVAMLAISGVAFARGTEHHGASAKSGRQMKKLHDMMPMFTTASAGLEKAIDAGDIASAERAARQILTAIPDLKNSSPHKNAKQKKKYVQLSANLEQAVKSTADLAKQGDKAGAKAAFRKVETACAACHAQFRD